MPTITLDNNKQFSVKGDETLLDAAKASNLVLEHSCRTGRCGVCKAKVISGTTRVLKTEECLSVQDSDDGLILTCCRTAESDVVLGIEDLGHLANIETKNLPCRIDSLERLTSNIIKVVLRLPPNSGFVFLPGQYINIIGKTGIRRSYSIANAPNVGGKLELHIRMVEQGVMSKYWFTEAKVNDLLRLEGPLGTFILREPTVTNIVFVATGTGIAPVKSMLEVMTKKPDTVAGMKIHIYWGCRTAEDIYWKPDAQNMEMLFHPILSRPDACWGGRSGYVQNAVICDQIPLDDAVVLACGSSEMILALRQKLVDQGLDLLNFYSDAFISSN